MPLSGRTQTTSGPVPVRLSVAAAPPPEKRKRNSCSADGRTRWRRSHPAGLAGLISAIQSRRRATPWPVSACTAGTEEHGAPAHGFGPSSGCTTRRPSTFFCACVLGVFFIFIFFKKTFYRNIFLVLDFTVLYPYRPTEGGRELYVNKNNFFCVEILGGRLPPSCRAAGPLPPHHLAAGPGGGKLPPQI